MPLSIHIAIAALVAAIIVAIGIVARRGNQAGTLSRNVIPLVGVAGLVIAALIAHYAGQASARDAESNQNAEFQTRSHWDAVTVRDAEEFCMTQKHAQAQAQPRSGQHGTSAQDDAAMASQCRAEAASQVAGAKDEKRAGEAATQSKSDAYWESAASSFWRAECVVLALMLLLFATTGRKPSKLG